MAINKKHFAFIDGRLNVKFEDIVKWKQNKLLLKEKRVEIIIKKVVKHRSGEQNRYAHAVVFTMLANAIGCTMEESKDALKQRFLSITLSGGLKSSKPTHLLTTVELEVFLKQCRQLASEMFGLYIPLPNEVSF